MAWKRNILVVANVTATSSELVDFLKERARQEPSSFTFIVPATPFGGGRETAIKTFKEAVAKLREAGLEADGTVGHPDPVVAVTETWDPKRYDEIIVSTLPMRFSKWLHGGLPERIEKLTGAPVTHLASEPKHEVEPVPPPQHEDPSASLGPLSVLAWGRHKEQ